MTSDRGTEHCARAWAHASAHMDGELAAHEAAQLRAHLRRCATCRATFAELRAWVRLLRAAPQERLAVPVRQPTRRRRRARLSFAAAAATVLLALTPWAERMDGPRDEILAAERPAYLDSVDYERRLIADATAFKRSMGTSVALE